MRLLVVEDPESSVGSLLRAFASQDRLVSLDSVTWADLRRRPERLHHFDLLLPVTKDAGDSVSQAIAWLRSERVHTPILAVVPAHPAPVRFEAIARTADDFIVWRADNGEELWHRIDRLLGTAEHPDSVSRRLTQKLALASLIGKHPAFLATVEKIPLVARTDSPVLIFGETGTGKELCARAIHHLSGRRTGPFIPVDCSAVPDHLLENELFGHARGAFTDAHRDQGGFVAMAEGGTLFLDEIDSLAPTAQGKFLRLLQEHTYRPLGSDRFVHADIRTVAATNVDLEDLVRRRLFRSDLYFRLNVLTLTLPPLRERREDIALLAERFVERLSIEAGVRPKTLAQESIERLCRAPWPGNVRELGNVIQRAVVFSQERVIRPEHLGLPAEPHDGQATTAFRQARARALESFERKYVEALLRKHNGNVTRCAREAGHDRRAFGRLMKKYQIDRLAV